MLKATDLVLWTRSRGFELEAARLQLGAAFDQLARTSTLVGDTLRAAAVFVDAGALPAHLIPLTGAKRAPPPAEIIVLLADPRLFIDALNLSGEAGVLTTPCAHAHAINTATVVLARQSLHPAQTAVGAGGTILNLRPGAARRAPRAEIIARGPIVLHTLAIHARLTHGTKPLG